VTIQKISAWLGIALAAIGIPLKAIRILRQAEPLPWMAYDYVAALLLLVGAVLVLRGGTGRVLSAGWGFGVAMFYDGFFSYFEKWNARAGDHSFVHTMVVGDAIFLAVNVAGLVLSLATQSADVRSLRASIAS
jgi:hypothetical protein